MEEKLSKALNHFSKEEYNEALAIFKELLETDNKDTNLYNNIGLCYANLSDNKNAEEYYLKALELDNKLPQVYLNLTDIYYKEKRFFDAIGLLQNAVTYMPDNIALRHYLARIYMEDSRLDLAIDQLDEIIEQSPKNYDAYWDLARVYYELGEYNAAISHFEEVLENYQDNELIYYQVALAYEANDEVDKAISNYLKAIAVNDKFHPAFRKLGILFMARGDFQDAKEYFEEYLEFDVPQEEKTKIENVLKKDCFKNG